MTDSTPAPDAPDAAPAKPAVRRISNPRPKKSQPKPARDDSQASVTEQPVEPRPAPEQVEAAEASAGAGAWPEPEAPATGGPANGDAKRKRRRRKGKGQGANAHNPPPTPVTEEIHNLAEAAEPSVEPSVEAPERAPRQPVQPKPQPARTKLDPEHVATKAWKIYLAEVSEEGVALIGDQDARELARRCFRLAEIFLEEQSRRA